MKLFDRIKRRMSKAIDALDQVAFRDDLRKIGVGYIVAGILGVILRSDNVFAYEGVIILILGAAIWFIGLMRSKE